MANFAKRFSVIIILAVTPWLSITQPASGVTAEIAKKCRAEAIKAHPSPKPGSHGIGAEKAQRDYFRECVTKESNKESNKKD